MRCSAVCRCVVSPLTDCKWWHQGPEACLLAGSSYDIILSFTEIRAQWLYVRVICEVELCATDKNQNKLCAWRHNMPPPLLPVGAQGPRAPPSRRNVAVLAHAEYVPTLTAAAALRVKAAPSKAAWWPWPLTLKVVSESRVMWAISVPILVFLSLSVLDLGPMDATDRQTERRQTKASLNAPAY